NDLAAAYRATADERYARAWVAQFRSFAEQCPPPPALRADNTIGSTWRTIECGIRSMWTWPVAFHTFLRSPTVTDDDLLAWLHCSLDHARYLAQNPSSASNWLTMEMSGLYAIAAAFPEFTGAPAWRRTAIDTQYEQLAAQFLPDGAQFELSTSYHNVARDNITGIFSLAQALGLDAEFPPGYLARVRRAYDFNLHLMAPDRRLPRLNDSDTVHVPGTLRQALSFFPDRSDYRWIVTDGRQGTPPATTSHLFEYAGYAIMRTGWQPDATYALFDAGPLGAAHQHQDKLNLLLWSHGRELLFDSGGGSYERSKWREYGIDTHSHNTILVDGKPQRRDPRDLAANVATAPLDLHWKTTPARDYAADVYNEGYGDLHTRPATHTRRVLFLKPDILVVADTIVPNDKTPHTAQARWHLRTPATRHDPATGQAITTDAGLPNLAIIPLSTDNLETAAISAQTEPEILGWDVRKDTIPQCVPATTVLHTRRAIAGPQHFLTLLLALPATADPARNPLAAPPPLPPPHHPPRPPPRVRSACSSRTDATSSSTPASPPPPSLPYLHFNDTEGGKIKNQESRKRTHAHEPRMTIHQPTIQPTIQPAT
ncbi:MAG: heparinase II/III family protein, partial [Opitutaceae bacterium]|nr:heparinase II/III family protein [Opitutaceae bacterium]